MQPVVDYLKSKGLRTNEVVAVITGHPPVLSYSVEARVAPFWEYMQGTVGLQVGVGLWRGGVGGLCRACGRHQRRAAFAGPVNTTRNLLV